LSPPYRRVRSTERLLFEHFFDVADLLLHLTANLFGGTLILEIGVVRSVPHFLFHRALNFVSGALNFVLYAVFHEMLLCRLRRED